MCHIVALYVMIPVALAGGGWQWGRAALPAAQEAVYAPRELRSVLHVYGLMAGRLMPAERRWAVMATEAGHAVGRHIFVRCDGQSDPVEYPELCVLGTLPA